MTTFTRAEFTPVLLELIDAAAKHLGFDPAAVIAIDENMPKFTLHLTDGRAIAISVSSNPPETGVPLTAVISAFMLQIGKTIDDVKDVDVQLPFIYITLNNGEKITIETAAPGGDFPTQH